jgi:hypothetical protein
MAGEARSKGPRMELINDPDRGRARRAMAAMMKMVKIGIAELERAVDAA